MINLNNENFSKEVLEYNGKVVIDVWASWCGRCKMVKPKYIDLSTTNTEYKFCMLDADNNPELMEELKISNLPTFIMYSKGKEVMRGGVEMLNNL